MFLNIIHFAKMFLLQILIISLPLNLNFEIDDELNSLLENVSIGNIETHVQRLVNFKTRYALSKNCNESAIFLSDYFSSLKSFRVELHNFTVRAKNPIGSTNVVAYKYGMNRRDENIILFAHYDSISDYPNVSAPGANDNACGVAIIMEVARIINCVNLNRTLIFIAFSAEELGLVGSQVWIKENDAIVGNAIAAICLDGVGRGDKISIIFADDKSNSLADLVFNISNMLDFEDFKKAQSLRSLMGTDSGAFFGKGIPVIRLWDEDTQYIHTTQDISETIYQNRLVETTKVILATIQILGTAPLENLFHDTNSSNLENKYYAEQIKIIAVIGVIFTILLIVFSSKKIKSRIHSNKINRNIQ